MEEFEVTARDLEVARQMHAPERVIESMEAGEWLYPSDRVAVRYAERAIDHMLEVHGQECEAQWSTVPWLLKKEAKVRVVAAGGAYDGVEATVRVSSAKGNPCMDDWYLAVHGEECAQVALGVLEEALECLSRKVWAARAKIRADRIPADVADDLPAEEMLERGFALVYVYLASSAVDDKVSLEELLARVLDAYRNKDYEVYVWMAVVPDAVDGDAMSVEYGSKQVTENNELMTASDAWRRG